MECIYAFTSAAVRKVETEQGPAHEALYVYSQFLFCFFRRNTGSSDLSTLEYYVANFVVVLYCTTALLVACRSSRGEL
jgi:hypothetical protein